MHCPEAAASILIGSMSFAFIFIASGIVAQTDNWLVPVTGLRIAAMVTSVISRMVAAGVHWPFVVAVFSIVVVVAVVSAVK